MATCGPGSPARSGSIQCTTDAPVVPCAGTLGHGVGSAETRQFIKGPSFGTDQLGDVKTRIELTADARLSVISVDRVIGIASRLVDHVDAFIDAVIVWEKLFGTGDNQELSYRVSTNMACVLSDSAPERLELQSEIKKLYGLRSQIVHGGKHLTNNQARGTFERAQVLTLTALRRLLTEPRLVGGTTRDCMALVLGAQTDE